MVSQIKMRKAKQNNFLLLLAGSTLILILFVYMNLNGGFNFKKTDLVAEGFNADLSGEVYANEEFGYFDGENHEIPEVAFAKDAVKPVLSAVSETKWIEVDLSEQKLIAWEGDHKYLETAISTGLPGTPTPRGEFKIWIKLRATKMEGGSGRGYYYLPNVPYVMFFENEDVPGWKGYGIHGTYWHSDFGTPRSHGCVNVPTPIAKQLYEWTTPVLEEGKGTVRAGAGNLGTRIVIHE